MATLKEIAKKSNTSITTVSRVLNDDETLSVSDEVRKKIKQIALDLDYKTPRKKAERFKYADIHIGVIVWYDSNQELDDPYYMQIRQGVENLAHEMQIRTTVVYKGNHSFDLSKVQGAHGFICIGKFSDEQITSFEKVTNQIVFVDSSPKEDFYDSVVINFRSAVVKILNVLIENGYKEIGYLGGIEYISNHILLGERRELVFKEYLEFKNMLNKDFIHVGNFSIESGYSIMKDIIESDHKAEVYFCANDSIAIGALRAIHEAGLKVPEDIGLFGFNDNPNAAYTYPTLSTLKVYTKQMGEEALKSIIDRIKNNRLPIKKILPTKVILRKSIKYKK